MLSLLVEGKVKKWKWCVDREVETGYKGFLLYMGLRDSFDYEERVVIAISVIQHNLSLHFAKVGQYTSLNGIFLAGILIIRQSQYQNGDQGRKEGY
jgi:hypothetical protein